MWNKDQIIKDAQRERFFDSGAFYIELASHPLFTENINLSVDVSVVLLNFMSDWLGDILNELFHSENYTPQGEGNLQRVLVNRYERSKMNRKLAVLLHGLESCNFYFKH